MDNSNITRDYFIYRKSKISYLAHNANHDSKPVIVIAHANGYSAYTYRWYMEHLSKEYSVYAMDFWGHSKSEGRLEEDGYTGWLLFRDQIIAFIQEMNFRSVTMIGHSLGGGSSILAASKKPELFKNIIALDPVVLGLIPVFYGKLFQVPLAKGAIKRRTTFKSIDLVRKAYRKSPAFKDWNQQIYEDYLHSAFISQNDGSVKLALDPRIEAKIFNAVSFRNILFRLKNITVPVHIITPKNSHVCPKRTAKKIIRKCRNSTYETWPGITHFFPFEKPEFTLEEIRKYLKKEEYENKTTR